MTSEDNVVKMPDRLERRAQKIEAAMTRRENGDTEWIEGTIELAVELAGARADHGDDDRKFGVWLKGRFGNNQLPHQDRSILIKWGKDPGRMRVMLEKTENRSIQRIDSIFTTNSKDTAQGLGGPKLREAKDKILAYEAVKGKLPPADRHFEMPGIKPSTYDRAIREVRGVRAEAEMLGPLKLTKATAVHIESILARRTRELEDAFRDHVRKAAQKLYDENFPTLEQEKLEAFQQKRDYERLFNNHEHIFTMAEYNDLLLCTHEANPSDETRKRAFMALNARKFQLTGKR